MGVMLQAFYWDCPRLENKEFEWWKYITGQIPSLAQVGFTSLWLPPVHKAANIFGPSMGYDPYDYYDLGEFDQKGGVPTWFGTKAELLDMIAYPVLVKKGAFDGLDQDVWARLSPGIFMGHESMPDDVVREIIRVRHKYRAEMARYHAALAFFPQTPYPVGTPEKWVHPGVKKAMESLNIPMP